MGRRDLATGSAEKVEEVKQKSQDSRARGVSEESQVKDLRELEENEKNQEAAPTRHEILQELRHQQSEEEENPILLQVKTVQTRRT